MAARAHRALGVPALQSEPAANAALSEAGRLYAEVVVHYRGCERRDAYLSDTWAHTLAQRGDVFSLEAMLSMLSLGNRVNTWIDDFNYLIDGTILDAEDPIVARLLELGESDFGSPRKDVKLGDRWFSSNFIHHVLYAMKIIRAIEVREIASPRVLEIGGGLAGVGYLLRRNFGERLTYFSADLPETLLIQEWYLRNCFPDAPHTFKGDAAPARFVPGGLNFINAYVIESQDFEFDVAVNIDSMQEMNSEAVAAYLGFIERNITPDGFFFFQNHYGHASSSVPEPSEYPLDASWTIGLAEAAPQIECCTGSEQIRLIFSRTPYKKEDPAARRFVLRLIWNGFVSGRIVGMSELTRELALLPACHDRASIAAAALEVLRRHEARVEPAQAGALAESLYFPHRPYVEVLVSGPRAGETLPAFGERHLDALWRAQSGFLKLLHAAVCGLPAEAIRGRRHEIAGELAALRDTSRSEFWSSYLAAILFVLGEAAIAKDLLAAAAEHSGNPFWTVRWATLLCRFGLAAEAWPLLNELERDSDLDYFVALKTAELFGTYQDGPEADRILTRLGPPGLARGDLARCVSFAKTAARLGRDGLARQALAEIVAWTPDPGPADVLGVLAASPAKSLHDQGEVFARRLAERLRQDPDDDGLTVALGLVRLELGQRDEALSLVRPLAAAKSLGYFRLGQVGKYMQHAGLDGLADQCLETSMELRPGNFLHLEFVGNVYFAAGRFDKAASAYARALDLRPYPRHVLARHLYSRLPDRMRASGLLGLASDLRLVFQREQDFYHDLGPASK